MRRTQLTIIVVAVFVIALGLLPLDIAGVNASPLRQLPPTSTPAPPTDTPAPPTNTPLPPTSTPVAPTNTPVVPTLPSNTPTVTPTPFAPVNPPRSGGSGGAPPGPSATPVVNGCVKSIGKDGVSLGTEPGFYQPHVQIAPRGDILLVVAGPVHADKVWWWRLRTNTGTEGWGDQDFITPDPGPCAFGGVAIASALPASPQPAQASALPQTGSGTVWWPLAILLTVVVIIVGVIRRRLQVQAGADGDHLRDDRTDM